MVRLRGITWDHPRGYAGLAASVTPYHELTGVEIDWQVRSLKDFGDAPIDKLAESFDILIVDHPHMGLAEATGCLLPLDAHMNAEALAIFARQSAGPSHDSYFYGGRHWVLAVDAACQASAYRADLLTEALPSTWDDVITLGQRARAQGRWVGLPLLPTDCICSFLTLCACLGDPPGVDEGTLLHDPAVGLRALELLKTLHAVGHPDALRWNPILMLNHMSSHHDLVYCPLTFTYSNYSRDGYVEKRVHYTNIPGVRGSILGGAGFAVSAHCRNVAEAVAYGMWICSADVQRTLYVERGGQPGNGVAWEDDHANAITHNFFRDTYDTLRAAYVRPRYNGYHVFQEEAGNLIHAMLRDSTGTQDCLAAVTRLYDETLRRGRG